MQSSANLRSRRLVLKKTFETRARGNNRAVGWLERKAEDIQDAEAGWQRLSCCRVQAPQVWDASQLYALVQAYRGAWRVLRAVDSPLVWRQRSKLTRLMLRQRISERVAGGLLDIDQLRADSLTFIHRYCGDCDAL